MLVHSHLGASTFKRSKTLYLLIRSEQVRFAGYVKNKIFGTYHALPVKELKLQTGYSLKTRMKRLPLVTAPVVTACLHRIKRGR